MILLDTNVVSELMRPRPDARVAAFLAARPLEELFLPSLVVAEIRYGLARLPDGQRRNGLEGLFERLLSEGFGDRVLPFDASGAAAYARARAARESAGRPIALADALIAGMALAHGASLATRNIDDFDQLGLTLLNPWDTL
ncbi:type II toxin-antitoxin system VapC family toxin [Muricoccus aerilatus]|uniref:type II toxin-antitoxin system VapC family toxin n=1 Tax=Muricoccus aerilatus TaxID=452982 RepID=UPI0005C18934|nr:type II toxin-antitoxin system VapC family toxin [Roseomonas aerilata]